MKFRVTYRRKTGITRFCVDSDKDETLGYVEAETLRRGGLVSLVPLVYEQRGRTYRFTYAADGFVPLSRQVEEPFAPRQLERMVTSFFTLLLECEDNGLKRQRVCADPAYILYDESARCCRFVYIPLQSFSPTENDLKAALIFLCDRAQVPGSDVALRDRILDYLRRSAVMTSVDFGAFLRSVGLVGEGGTTRFAAIDDSGWLDTDQLGARAHHGFDFVSSQRQRAALEQFTSPAGAGAVSARDHCAEDASSISWGQAASASVAVRPARDWEIVRSATGAAWILGEGTYDIGRLPQCSIGLPDVSGLSRRHVEVCVRGAGCSVRDLGSTNGVRVNGARIPVNAYVPVRRGDVLTLGEEQFELR